MKNLSIMLLSAIIAFSSCSQNPYKRDVSDISIEFSLLPFYTDILDLSTNFTETKRTELSKKYGLFFESFNSQILKIGVSTDSLYATKLNTILHDEWFSELYKATNKQFNNTKELEEKLTEALQYYKFYFPNNQIPRVCGFIGAVQYSVVLDSNMIAIGLDKYLGSNFEMYKQMEISSFIRRNMHAEKIPTDFMRAIVENEFPDAFTENYLLANMIQQGRYMYFVKSMLPNEADTLLWGYTSKQLEFCQKSESEFWKYLVSTDNLLFSTDMLTIKRFTDEGPFTPVFTKESPGKVGQWLGFKIVESFMKNNPNITLAQLFAIKSSQEIMSKAKYNP